MKKTKTRLNNSNKRRYKPPITKKAFLSPRWQSFPSTIGGVQSKTERFALKTGEGRAYEKGFEFLMPGNK